MGNRPDGEAHDQPAWTSLVAEAEWHGVSARQISVVSEEIGPDHLKRFAEVLHDQPTPIAAHCRIGPRSAMLWALVNPDGLNVDEWIAVAATQSYDLAPLRDRMDP